MACKCNNPIPRSIDAVMRVLNGPGAAKWGNDWETRPDHLDMDAALRHEVRADDAEFANYDADTGELHATLALCRRLLVLERLLHKEYGDVETKTQTKTG